MENAAAMYLLSEEAEAVGCCPALFGLPLGAQGTQVRGMEIDMINTSQDLAVLTVVA